MAIDLDAHQQTAKEVLLGELDYNLPATASYVVDRRTQSFFTNSAGTFGPDGVRNLTINLNGDNIWAALDTLTVSFTVKNVSPTPDIIGTRRYVLSSKTDGPWNVVSRLRVSVSGSLVEDLQDYNRLHEMFYRLLPKSQKKIQASMGYVIRENEEGFFVKGTIANQDTYTCSFKPLSGLFNTGKCFPVCWCPIRIDIELAPGVEAWDNYAQPGDGPASLTFVPNYQLENARVNVDTIVLDSGMQESYARLLESGRTLPLTITSFSHYNQAILGNNPNVSLTRACSSIRDVAWSFTRERDADYNRTLGVCNDFVHPHDGLGYRDGGQQLTDRTDYSAQWFLGSKMLGPEGRFRNTHEMFFSTLKSIGMHAGGAGVEMPDLDLQRFRSSHHVPIVSLERALQVASTGLSSRSGSLLTCQLYDLPRPAFQGVAGGDVVEQMYIVIMHQVGLSMSKYGTVVSS